MYERFYGFREAPFELTPNPKYLFLTAKHREALSNLQYGIAGRRGVTLLVGEAGTGKTTLVRTVLDGERRKNTRCVYLNNPTLTRAEFVEFLAGAFELSERAATSKTALLQELERVLLERQSQGIATALMVDEAQVLPLELLEEVRLLANIETASGKLLSIVLSGQPQLADKLNHPDLRQLKQRVALRCTLQPLDLNETAAYIAARIRTAGGDGAALFTREAVELIHRCSQGIPRTISVVCDNALLSGFAADQRLVGREIVREVCRDFDLLPPAAVAPAASRSSRAAEAPVGRARTNADWPKVVPLPGPSRFAQRPERPMVAQASKPPVDVRMPQSPIALEEPDAPKGEEAHEVQTVEPEAKAKWAFASRGLFGSLPGRRRFLFF
jgi:general secretion pathway protein A